MSYVAIVGSTGHQPPEAVAQMQRDWPAYEAEVERLGIEQLGRSVDLPTTALTVRRRAGEVLVTDGPFAETKEHVAGFNLIEADDLDGAARIVGISPVARFIPFELRPATAVRRTERVPAFTAWDDAAGTPYLLMAWADHDPWQQPVAEEHAAWQDRLDSSGELVLGIRFGGPATATTLRTVEGVLGRTPGSFLTFAESVYGFDVLRCERGAAVAAAATHPLAATAAVEVRPFETMGRASS